VEPASNLLFLVSAKTVTYIWQANVIITAAIVKMQRKLCEFRPPKILGRYKEWSRLANVYSRSVESGDFERAQNETL